MNIEIINNIDANIFNEYVSNSTCSSIYQTIQWSEARRKDKWQVEKFILKNEDKIICTAICLYKILPLNLSIFYLPRGPIIDYSDESNKEYFNLLFSQIIKFAKSKNAIFIRSNPDIEKNNLAESWFDDLKFIKNTKPILHTTTFRIDLTKSEDELMNAMESRTKYDIRRAEKEIIKIEIDSGAENDLKEFYTVLKTVSNKNEFPIYNFEQMKELWKIFRPNNMCRIFFTKKDDKIISAAFVFIFGKKVIYQWGGSLNLSKINPNQLLHWEIIKWCKSNKYLIYDFQGVPENPTKDNPLWGIYLFKRGFGGRLVTLSGEYDYVLNKAIYFIWKKIELIYPKLKFLFTRK